jgi:oligoribonuclease (3'-5' exoribonuclease)
MVVSSYAPKLFYKKKNVHRALDDIRESIGELKFYIEHAFSF